MRADRVIIARYLKDWPRSERLRISIAHPSSAWASCGPTKCPAFSWRNVQMHSISRQCCILTKFRFVLKSTCVFFFQALIIMKRINAPAPRGCKVDFRFLTYVSSSICCIKTIGSISIRFTGIDQLHILYTSNSSYESTTVTKTDIYIWLALE